MECLNPEAIERYVKKLTKEEEHTAIEHHIRDCNNCREHINDALANESLLGELYTHHLPTISYTSDQLPTYQSLMSTSQAQEILKEQYTVVKKIGQGGSGEVFQAIDPTLERPVAIKFFREEIPFQKWVKDQWQEGKFMSQMNHPHIAHIYHIGQNDGKRYIVMEWIDGIPLTQAWEKEPLSRRLALFLQVLEAIDTAHKKGIIHRDIKPSNILVSASGEVKVLDFGIAMAVDYGHPTEGKVYRGTPAYSAPEQITSPDKISTSTDVFSLGVLLYQLLTNNNLPFPQIDSKELFEAICTQNPELPSAIQETVPLPLQNICLKALEKDTNNRYRDAHALASDISRYLRGEKVWSRPSFVNDQIQQEIFYHRQRLDVWHKNGLLTEREHDKLETIYGRVVAPADLSIIESRKLSFSQVCLYLGGWITVLGCAVLLSSEWGNIPRVMRPLPAIFSVLVMIMCGRYLWAKKEGRLSVGFLATGCLLLPVAILLMLGHYRLFSPDVESFSLGTESVAEMFPGFPPTPEAESPPGFYIGNLQLLIATSLWMATSFFFLRIIRSSIFVIFCVLSFLGILSTFYTITGMEDWRLDIIAGRYLFPGIIFFALGMFLDHKKVTKYAWPLSATGLLLIVACLSYIAMSDETLFVWILPKSEPPFALWYEKLISYYLKPISFLCDKDDDCIKALGFFCNGIFYLGLAWFCRRQKTRLHRMLGQIFNWLGPLHILISLRVLDELTSGNLQMVYQTALPVASLAFIFGSVSRQMKSFVFSGLSGLAVSVQKFTVEYFEDAFSWPITLVIIGLCFMLLSWWVPRLRARQTLKRE